MSSINHHTREITVKIVYYGPGLGGKTSSLQCLHQRLPQTQRGQLVSLATSVDRTLYFDFLPIKLPKVRGFNIRVSLYTVPGQVHYNQTRKLVLQGVDGVVFVADSQKPRREANIESMNNLADNLLAQGMDLATTPLVLAYNKRDLGDLQDVSSMQQDLNPQGRPQFETCAVDGRGISESLKTIIRLVLADLKRKGIYKSDTETAAKAPVPVGASSHAKDRQSASQPQVSSSIEEGLALALREHQAQDTASVRRLSLSELWEPELGRGEILAMEGDIEREDYMRAVRRAQGLLFDFLGQGQSSEGVVEDLLLLGVHGPHYARFRAAVMSAEPSRRDAMFCLFFLVDIALRQMAAPAALS